MRRILYFADIVDIYVTVTYIRLLGVIGMTTDNKIFIEREYGDKDEVEFSFRYVDIDSRHVQKLKKRLGDLKHEVHQNSENSFVLVLPLDLKLNADDINSLNQDLKLSTDKYGVYISFYTGYDHAGFNLPEYVREFYLIVGGQFDVSTVNI